jgi:signal transduction histidine kinase
VFSDRDSRAVILNLAINARRDVAGRQAALATWDDGDQVALAVSDTGTGIPDGAARILSPSHHQGVRGTGSASPWSGIVQQSGGS